jgi:beta-phosphoglucomutase
MDGTGTLSEERHADAKTILHPFCPLLCSSLSVPGRRTHSNDMPVMTRSAIQDHSGGERLKVAIFDVDGVLLATPHERAWREALADFSDPARFTHEFYEAFAAGKPRLDGAKAILDGLGVPGADTKAALYSERKQRRLEELIRAGRFDAFPDALRFVQAVAELGWPMAAASSSKNARAIMKMVTLPGGGTLLDIFSADVCGRDLPHGKPDPAIFLLAASELDMAPACCFVAEDAPAGIEAARAGGMAALGIARRNDAHLLRSAGADLIVASLDEISIQELAAGRLGRKAS